MRCFDINLLPYRAQKRLLRGWLYVSSLVLIISPLIYGLMKCHHHYEVYFAQCVTKNHVIKMKWSALNEKSQALKKIEQQQERWRQEAQIMESIFCVNKKLRTTLEQVVENMGEKMLLQSVKLVGDKIVINGCTSSRKSIANLIQKINGAQLSHIDKQSAKYVFSLEIFL